jgi:peptidoglycan/xylan/chitin deacetylase (PgdA/CDA1 family)
MLDSHPALAIANEAHFVASGGRRRRLYERPHGFDIDRFLGDFGTLVSRELRCEVQDVREALSSAEPASYTEAIRAIFSWCAVKKGKTRYGNKSPVQGAASQRNAGLRDSQGRGVAVKAEIKNRVDSALRWSPAQVAFHWRSARTLSVLAYHAIGDPDRFEQHVAFLSRHMNPITLQDLLDAVEGRSGLPKRAVLLTFDDGDRTVIDVAMPILRDRGSPGVAFVLPGLLDTDRPFWWNEVEDLVRAGGRTRGFGDRGPEELVRIMRRLPTAERLRMLDELRGTSQVAPPSSPHLARHELPLLESAGIEVGNHTYSHARLVGCTADEAMAEIGRAHSILGTTLAHPPRAFAYPNGEWDRTAEQVLQELGYRAAFLFDHSSETVPPTKPLRISRLRVDATTSMDRLRIILSGLHTALHRLRGLP